MTHDGVAAVERVFREESGRAVATLVRLVGDVGVAEEMVQEAFEVALRRWPVDGVPPRPAAWIITTARNRAIDRHRRESTRTPRSIAAALAHAPQQHADEVEPVPDDELRLLFLCAHPALSLSARVALSLRLVGGLTSAEIAAAFLVPESTMAQRLVRATSKIRDAAIPYRVPDQADLPARLDSVLHTIYLVSTEGHAASAGADLARLDLSREAIRLARRVVALLPDQPEARGLLALVLLVDARRATRTAADGTPVLLADQDRSRWDRDRIAEGHAIVRGLLAENRPGPYQLQAAIQAVHTDATTASDTDWGQVLALYDQLWEIAPTDVVALNRAVALAEAGDPAGALAVVDDLDRDTWHRWHLVRGELLARTGDARAAAIAVGRAASLADNDAERRYLERRRRALTTSGDDRPG